MSRAKRGKKIESGKRKPSNASEIESSSARNNDKWPAFPPSINNNLID